MNHQPATDFAIKLIDSRHLELDFFGTEGVIAFARLEQAVIANNHRAQMAEAMERAANGVHAIMRAIGTHGANM